MEKRVNILGRILEEIGKKFDKRSWCGKEPELIEGPPATVITPSRLEAKKIKIINRDIKFQLLEPYKSYATLIIDDYKLAAKVKEEWESAGYKVTYGKHAHVINMDSYERLLVVYL